MCVIVVMNVGCDAIEEGGVLGVDAMGTAVAEEGGLGPTEEWR